ncbi:MAG: rhodanese-like domain-containing protein, partial [Bdellovibrionales bacterium]|nr:rhodanese-like domain-containing protein [Bdellovibrionales bacterium]
MSSYNTVQRNPDFEGVQDIQPTEVHSVASQVSIIDVREPDEFVGELGHIAGAVLIPLGQLESRWNEIPKSKDVIFICRSGRRSAKASQFANSKGEFTS